MDKPYEYDKVRFGDDDAVIRNNKMIGEFLKSDSDILVKMDIDHKYRKNYLTVMVPLVEKYRMIGPLIYSKRRRNFYSPLLYDEDIYPRKRLSTDWSKRTPENGILEIYYAHTNLFYHREVFKNVEPPWYEAKYSKDCCGYKINRDFSFIEKLIKQGFKTYINMNMVVSHLVEEAVNTRTYEKWRH
jgi:hypothetical protein